jgi:hypothetical protein
METFVLIAWFALWGPHGGDVVDMRVPGLSWAECKARAREFAQPRPLIGGAYCAADRPEPAAYTLHVWIRRGTMRFEERHIPDLSEADCRARSDEIDKDGARGVRTTCARSGYRPSPPHEIQCAACGELPGRKRI